MKNITRATPEDIFRMYKKLHGDRPPKQKKHIIILRRWMWCGSAVCLGTRQNFEKRQDGWYCLSCGRKYHSEKLVLDTE